MALTTVIRPLSGSTDGVGITLSATVTDTLIHTGPSSTSVMDQLFMYANNSTSLAVTIRMQYGGSANIAFGEIPARSRIPIFEDLRIFGVSAGNSATLIQMGASTSAIIDIYGHVNRVTES
jgi:hypothetical protein